MTNTLNRADPDRVLDALIRQRHDPYEPTAAELQAQAEQQRRLADQMAGEGPS